MQTETKSLTVVISGPDATAGSIPIFLKKIGISVPTRLAISIAIKSEIPIQNETAKPDVLKVDTKLVSKY